MSKRDREKEREPSEFATWMWKKLKDAFAVAVAIAAAAINKVCPWVCVGVHVYASVCMFVCNNKNN